MLGMAGGFGEVAGAGSWLLGWAQTGCQGVGTLLLYFRAENSPQLKYPSLKWAILEVFTPLKLAIRASPPLES